MNFDEFKEKIEKVRSKPIESIDRENIPAEKQPEWMKNLKEDDNPVLLMVK